jgi:lipopolysaccharide assembly protein A
MRILSWIFYLLIFVLALGFALSNTGEAELSFPAGGYSWRAPLVVFLLVFLAAGVVIGLLAAVPALFRQRREISRLNRELRRAASAAAPAAPLPAEAAVGPGIGLGV